jgi:hypothetical protein
MMVVGQNDVFSFYYYYEDMKILTLLKKKKYNNSYKLKLSKASMTTVCKFLFYF